jgi:hypothetical protein
MATLHRVVSRSVRALVLTAAFMAACRPAQLPAEKGVVRPTKSDRISDISRAKIWTATNVAAMDVRAGPTGKGALPPFAHVDCDYVDKKPGGATPKFDCALSENDKVKIKYGVDNPEVYGEVAGSRLLWALGFGADRWYPVSVTCHRCPADPHKDPRPTDGDTTFDVAALERPMEGRKIETRPDQGWDWTELRLIKVAADGAPVEQRDALRLLAVFMQHTDTKPEQQRLICRDGNTTEPCPSPFMYLHDIGLTFGKASLFNSTGKSGANFEQWSKARIWKDREHCVGNLPRSFTGTLGDPIIRESGRKFLADLLQQLSDQQIHDLFEVARFPQQSGVSADDWVALFKTKRADIVNTTCRN